MSARRGARRAALLLLLAGLLALPAGPAVAGPPGTPGSAARVLVVGVPGLLPADLDPAGTPRLWALAERGSVGALSVRAARAVTCRLDGWATLGAGNRAAASGPTPVAAGCAAQEGTGPADARAALAAAAAAPGTARFGARPGALGAAVGCAGVSGAAAGLAVAADGVRLEPGPAGDCPLAVASLDDLASPGELAGPGERAAALARVDAAAGRLVDAATALPGPTLLLVAGVAETGTAAPALHVVIAAGPGFPAGRWLTSASTGRSPYAQLIDLAPTALAALGRPAPPDTTGTPLADGGARPPLPQALRRLGDAGTAAAVHHAATGPLFWLLTAGCAVLLAAGVPVLRRGSGAARRWLGAAALLLAALPAATLLAGLVPWERAVTPAAALAGAVLAADLAVAGAAVAGPWRRVLLGPPLAVLAVTAAALVVDVLTGSSLQRDGLLGYDAIVAGRFTGLGNLTWALLAPAALLLTAAAAVLVARAAPAARYRVGAVVAAGGLLTVVLDGAPQLGRDGGGVLAVVPAFGLLGLGLTGARVTVPRVLAGGAGAVLAAAGLAVLDRLRPAGERSHLGRFVDQVLDGRATTVLARRAADAWALVGSPLTWLLPVALAAAAWLARPGGGLLRGPGGVRAALPADAVAALRAGLRASALALLLGALANDSGAAVPAAGASLLVPLLVAVAARLPGPAARLHDPGARPSVRAARPAAPARRASGGRTRVSVRSRGSTVGHR